MVHEYVDRGGGGAGYGGGGGLGPTDKIISSSATNGEIFAFIRVYSVPLSFFLQST